MLRPFRRSDTHLSDPVPSMGYLLCRGPRCEFTGLDDEGRH
jgi:hypothetical protein